MKKILFLLAIMPMFLTGCSKDDNGSNKPEQFAYDVNLLYGSWDIVDGPIGMNAVEFTKDRRYTISGYDGNIHGAYEATGRTIVTYKGSEKYVVYDVSKLTETSMEMNAGSMSFKMERSK